jgi:hypothetical protein
MDPLSVAGFAKDMGSIQYTSDPVVFALGLDRDPVVHLQTANIDEPLYPLHKTSSANVRFYSSNFVETYSVRKWVDILPFRGWLRRNDLLGRLRQCTEPS